MGFPIKRFVFNTDQKHVIQYRIFSMKLVEIEPKSRQAKKCLDMHVNLFNFRHKVSF